MKKIMIMAMAIGALTFSSCSNDDGDNNSNDSGIQDGVSLVGTWEATDVYYEGETTQSAGGQSITTSFVGQSVSFDELKIVLNEDNTYTSSGGYVAEITTEIEGFPAQTQEASIDGFLGSGTWSLDGNILTTENNESNLNEDVPPSSATIETLTENKLVLVINGADLEGGVGQFGIDDVQAEYTFTRN